MKRKQKMVYVLNKDGKPLMSTERHGHVRKMLKSGKAKVVRHNPFTIQLTYESPGVTQPVILGVDPGRTNIGLCAVTEDGKPLFSAKAETRNKDIPRLMQTRKGCRIKHRQTGRRGKRKRRAKVNNTALKDGEIERHLPGYDEHKAVTCKMIRNKEAKFSNRKRPDGWLTPTANQLLQTHVNLVRLVSKFLPVSKVVIELNKFAFMRLDDPSVSGMDFQNGPLKGLHESVEEAVYELQNDICLLCSDRIEEYHHVRAKHKNGSETIKNRVGLCKYCHQKVHTDSLIEKKLLEKNKGLRKNYDALGVLNQIIPSLIEKLSEDYSVGFTAGWDTAAFREAHGLLKDHHLDAYAIACSNFERADIRPPEDCYRIRQFRRHDRKACEREMLDRKYVKDGKVVAINRHKRLEQSTDSLEEYIKAGNRTDNLTIKHGKKAMKDMGRFLPGCQIVVNGKVKTVLKRASGYYYFDNGSKSSCKKTKITLNNTGLVFVSNTGL